MSVCVRERRRERMMERKTKERWETKGEKEKGEIFLTGG